MFLSAVAQRTRRLRIGTLVYTLPLVHPLRLLEEICMLDQMSGRPARARRRTRQLALRARLFRRHRRSSSKLYTEGYQVLLQGLQSKAIDFEGEHYRFKNVPVELECVQKPTPPIWYGLSAAAPCRGRPRTASTSSATPRRRTSARSPTAIARSGAGRRAPRRAASADGDRPSHRGRRDPRGGDRDRQARLRSLVCEPAASLARARQSDDALSDAGGFPAAVAAGILLVGTSDEVAEGLQREIETSGVNYVLTRFAFGNLSFEESLHSLSLFTAKVMPEFASEPAYA